MFPVLNVCFTNVVCIPECIRMLICKMLKSLFIIVLGVNLVFRDGDFADFSAFADFFSVLPIFRISADFCSFEL